MNQRDSYFGVVVSEEPSLGDAILRLIAEHDAMRIAETVPGKP